MLLIGSAGFKVLLDVCDLDLMGPQNADKTSNLSATEHVNYSLGMLL